MKPEKEKFIETLLKLSYHAHQIDALPDEDKEYLDMIIKRDNNKFLYDEPNEEI